MEILMISLLILLFSIKLNSYLVIENLAIRQLLAIMKQSVVLQIHFFSKNKNVINHMQEANRTSLKKTSYILFYLDSY